MDLARSYGELEFVLEALFSVARQAPDHAEMTSRFKQRSSRASPRRAAPVCLWEALAPAAPPSGSEIRGKSIL